MGSMEDILKMIPGMDASKLGGAQIDEKQLNRTKAIIQSMTKAERKQSRDFERLAAESALHAAAERSIQEVNRLMNQFNASRQTNEADGRARDEERKTRRDHRLDFNV